MAEYTSLYSNMYADHLYACPIGARLQAWRQFRVGLSSRNESSHSHIWDLSRDGPRRCRYLGLSAIRPLRRYPGHPGPAGLPETSSASIRFPGPAGEGHAVPGPVGDAEVPLQAFRHVFKKVGWRPVDEFHQEAVRERADDLERQFVHDVRRNRDLVRGRMAADSHCLGKTVGAANVGHEIARGAALDELPEFEAGVVVLAGRDRNLDRVRDFRAGRDLVREHRLFLPPEGELFERLVLSDVPLDGQALVHVHHHAHAIAQRAAHRTDALRVLTRVGVVDLHLVTLAAERRVFLGFGDQLALAVLRPAAAAVGGNPVGDRAPELVQRQPRPPAGEVPQADIERRKRIGDDTLLLHTHVRAEHLFPKAL